MLSVHNILDEEGKRGVEIFTKCIEPYKATGRTQASAYYKVSGSETKTTLEIDARGFVKVLETGSKPSTKKPSPEMLDTLKAYAQVRNIPQNKVYGLALSILKNGVKANRNVYSNQMEKFSEEVADRVTEEFAGYAIDNIVKAFK